MHDGLSSSRLASQRSRRAHSGLRQEPGGQRAPSGAARPQCRASSRWKHRPPSRPCRQPTFTLTVPQSRESHLASRQPWSSSYLPAPVGSHASPPQCAQKPGFAGFEHIVGRARRAKRGAGGQSAGQAGREDRVRKEVMTQPSPDLADSTCQESYPLRYGGRPSMRSVGGRVSGPGDLAPKPTQ